MRWGEWRRSLAAAVLLAAVSGCDESGGDFEDVTDTEDFEDVSDSDGDGEEPRGEFPTQAPTDVSTNYVCDFTEDFEGPTGAPWPEPWVGLGEIAAADLRDGWGRLRPEAAEYGLARMIAPLDCQDFDISVTVMFMDKTTQAAAVYGRQNGGYLQKTTPRGRGYAISAENFREPAGLAPWRELGGIEQDITSTTPLPIDSYVPYRLRMRIKQQTPEATLLQGKIWPLDEPEPAQWSVEVLDSANALRKRPGSIALDAYSSLPEGSEAYDIYFDDLVVKQASDPPVLMELGW